MAVEQRVSQTIALGSSRKRVPALGVGTWAWGDRWLWQYGQGFSDEDLREAFDASVAAGLTFFDTAEVYGGGRSETLLGSFIRVTGAKVVVATKFLPFPWRLGKSTFRRALRVSLRRLEMDSVDLYQMHWPFPPVPIARWMDAMADAAADGLIKAVGVSNYSVEQMRRAHAALARRGIPLVSNQVRFNLLDRGPLRSGLRDACRELGVTLIAYSPIAMGVLTGKYTPEFPPPGRRSRRYNAQYLKRVEPLLRLVREIGAAHGKTMGQVALNWCIAKGTLPIPGVKNRRQAVENAGALGWLLRPEEIAALENHYEAG